MRILLALMLGSVLALGAGCGGSGGGSDDDGSVDGSADDGGGPTLSSDATLSALDVSAGTLAPPFDPGTTMYTMSVGLLTPSTAATPTATHADATITVDGAPVTSSDAVSGIALATGPTPISVVVTAADGTTQVTYTVVVTRADMALHEGTYLKASNAEASDQFGFSVALSGDTLVVGAPFEDSSAAGGEADNSESLAGAVYVYMRDGSSWAQQAYLKASNAGNADQFGRSVSISGETLVVGARSASVDEGQGSLIRAGAAYVFTRTGTTWSQQATLEASIPDAGDNFGYAVAVSGDTVVAGAIGESSNAAGGELDNTEADAGAAYVFTRTGTTWSQQAYLKASNAEAGDQFGWSVAASGETVVVGAHYEESSASGGELDNSAQWAGAAYVFVRTGATWTQQAYLKASNAEAADEFGRAVSLSGDTLVVGAFTEDSSAGGGEADNTEGSAGAAYVFTRTGTTWSQQALLKASNASSSDVFGTSVALSGDTVVVGASGEDSSLSDDESDNASLTSGAVYVFTRAGTTWSQQAYIKSSTIQSGDTFGTSVAVDGDTLAVGALGEDSSATGGEADASESNAGAAYVLR